MAGCFTNPVGFDVDFNVLSGFGKQPMVRPGKVTTPDAGNT